MVDAGTCVCQLQMAEEPAHAQTN